MHYEIYAYLKHKCFKQYTSIYMTNSLNISIYAIKYIKLDLLSGPVEFYNILYGLGTLYIPTFVGPDH